MDVMDSGHWLKVVLLMMVLRRSTADVPCPSGDTAGIIQDGKTCSELVTEALHNCYTIETSCCESCNNASTQVAGCEYGDSVSCFPFLCGNIADPSQCCDTCGTATTTTTTAAPSTTGGGAAAAGGSSDSESSDSVGKIVGGTVGGTVGAAAAAGVIFVIVKKLKTNKVTDDDKADTEEHVTVVPDGTGYNSSEIINEKITHANGEATVPPDNVKTNNVDNGDPFNDPRKHSLPALEPKSLPETGTQISPRNLNPLPPIGTQTIST